ncbi:MAG: alkaline phosphatase family protein, partial [Actinomycetota bacterium]
MIVGGGLAAGRPSKVTAVLACLLVLQACSLLGSSPSGSDPRARPPAPKARGGGPRARGPESWFRAACELPYQHLLRIKRGHYPGRSPDVIVIPEKPHLYGTFDWTSHSGPWNYMQEVPIVFYGPGVVRPVGELAARREVTVADIAPTVARMVGTDMPSGRAGRPIEAALEPEARREKPRLVVVVIWDGGGTNVLQRWPQAWPFLKSIMDRGAYIDDATVGSSPSLTPPVHATVGTGDFPSEHGIVDIPQRSGGIVADSYRDRSPQFLELPTIADLHDRRTANAARVGMFG